jgi:hypothetical protein
MGDIGVRRAHQALFLLTAWLRAAQQERNDVVRVSARRGPPPRTSDRPPPHGGCCHCSRSAALERSRSAEGTHASVVLGAACGCSERWPAAERSSLRVTAPDSNASCVLDSVGRSRIRSQHSRMFASLCTNSANDVPNRSLSRRVTAPKSRVTWSKSATTKLGR